MRHILYSALLGLLVFVSCTDEKDITPRTISDILTAGSSKTWKLDSITYRYFDEEDGAEEDLTLAFLEEFEADNLLVFEKDGLRFKEIEGPTKADTSDPEITSEGTFVLNSRTAALVFSATDRLYSVYYTIYGLNNFTSGRLEQLESTRIVYSFNGTAFAGFFGGPGDLVYYLSPVSGN
jgi:hypothetical protein